MAHEKVEQHFVFYWPELKWASSLMSWPQVAGKEDMNKNTHNLRLSFPDMRNTSVKAT
jgi:hypothetical protein